MNYSKKVSEGQLYLKQIRDEIIDSEHPEELLKKMYSYVKEVAPDFYVDGNMHPLYEILRSDVMTCENRLLGKFIDEAKPVFDFNDNSAYVNCILDYIVDHVRKGLVYEKSWPFTIPLDINRMDFENDCTLACKEVKALCDEFGLESHIVTIHPGYSKYAFLFNGNGFHMFNIVKVDGEYNLVDCTYRQFFRLNNNVLERLGVVNLAGVRAGRFMMMNDDRKQVANKILRDGWIKLDADVLKHYLDGFTISFRNGSYYEQTGDFSYTADYDIDTYIKFLSGEDSQVNQEGREVLGYQKKPLKNSKISF